MKLLGPLIRIESMCPPTAAGGLPPDYPRFLRELKQRICAARLKAVLSVNREMIALYWDPLGNCFRKQLNGSALGGPDFERTK